MFTLNSTPVIANDGTWSLTFCTDVFKTEKDTPWIFIYELGIRGNLNILMTEFLSDLLYSFNFTVNYLGIGSQGQKHIQVQPFLVWSLHQLELSRYIIICSFLNFPSLFTFTSLLCLESHSGIRVRFLAWILRSSSARTLFTIGPIWHVVIA